MISRYTDHAANERTYLAWVRTAIAVMAFGFLVEKFDLFLRITAQASTGRPRSGYGQVIGDVAGMLLIALGGTMMVVATVRFRQIGQDIDAPEQRPARGATIDVAMVGLLLSLGGTLFVYLVLTLFRQAG